MGIWYTTRESVKRALDSAETARNNWQVDQAIDSASRSVEGLTHRTFYPQLATRYFTWPSLQRGRTWRLWLDEADLISLTSLTAGGVAIQTSDLFLEPANSGPPYSSIEVDLASQAAFQSGSTHQRAIAVTGLFGYSADEVPAGALAEALDTSETAVDVTSSASVGVGDILRVDAERMVVTGKQMLATGQTLQADLAASSAGVAVAVSDGTAYSVDEVVLIDSERMLVVDIAGNNLIVRRAWDGSPLAAHSAGTTIYAPRTLVVSRGELGTTAAAHDTAAAVARHQPPGLVRQLALAEALVDLLQGQGGYAASQRSADAVQRGIGDGVEDLRSRCRRRYGRRFRTAAI